MSYKATWYTKWELSFIADFLNARMKLSNADRITSSSLQDETGTEADGTTRYATGGYGANVEEKLVNIHHVPRNLAMLALQSKEA